MTEENLNRGVVIQSELNTLKSKLYKAKKAATMPVKSFWISTEGESVNSEGANIEIYQKTLQITLNMIVVDLEKKIKKLQTEFYNL